MIIAGLTLLRVFTAVDNVGGSPTTFEPRKFYIDEQFYQYLAVRGGSGAKGQAYLVTIDTCISANSLLTSAKSDL